jgi:leucyl/phenylalanyl-tRNA--protein transferase
MGTPGILDERMYFPDPRQAAANGLVAIGGDLSAERLRLAYRSGIFPWTVNPISWWSPDPRGIFELDRFHVPRSFAKFLRRQPFSLTIDRAFRAVMEACAATNREGVWISPEFIEAYVRLHESGGAHSVECWQNEQLVGGIYGVSQGGLFAGESMFHQVTHASKVALWHLVGRLRERGFALFDIQMVTPATRQFGAVEISRDEYLRRVAKAVQMDCTFPA